MVEQTDPIYEDKYFQIENAEEKTKFWEWLLNRFLKQK